MPSYGEKLRDPRWQKKRLKILNRDKWICQICEDESKILHVHHIFYDGSNNPWDCMDESLITLCLDCHENEHEAYKQAIINLKKTMVIAGIKTADYIDYLESIIRENFKDGILNAKNSDD
jgi:hypothetical protein